MIARSSSVKQLLAATIIVLVTMIGAASAFAGSIEGTVREAGTRRPIPGVEVDVLHSDVNATTDDQGAFVLEFEETKVASATIVVDTPGYKRALQHVTLKRDGSVTV